MQKYLFFFVILIIGFQGNNTVGLDEDGYLSLFDEGPKPVKPSLGECDGSEQVGECAVLNRYKKVVARKCAGLESLLKSRMRSKGHILDLVKLNTPKDCSEAYFIATGEKQNNCTASQCEKSVIAVVETLNGEALTELEKEAIFLRFVCRHCCEGEE